MAQDSDARCFMWSRAGAGPDRESDRSSALWARHGSHVPSGIRWLERFVSAHSMFLQSGHQRVSGLAMRRPGRGERQVRTPTNPGSSPTSKTPGAHAERGDEVLVDTLTPDDRRKTMAAVKSRDTDIELLVRRALWARGLRYRLRTNLPGRPDIAFLYQRVVVFCDGCFWHGCPKCNERPVTNSEYWAVKIAANKRRDQS